MGYFDGLADTLFTEDSSGATLFHPWGTGVGFVLESEEKKNQIRKVVKTCYVVSPLIAVLIQTTIGLWATLSFVFVYCGFYALMMKKLTQGLPQSTKQITPSQYSKNYGKSQRLSTLVLLELASLGLVGASVWVLFIQDGIVLSLAALASIAFFGLCSMIVGYMIVVRGKSSGKKKPE